MPTDVEQLLLLNQELTVAENGGDMRRLAELVAPALAFRRRSGELVGREQFLVAPRPGERVLNVEAVQVYGERALVACVVTDAGVATHNLRLFTRRDGKWLVMGWANQPVPRSDSVAAPA